PPLWRRRAATQNATGLQTRHFPDSTPAPSARMDSVPPGLSAPYPATVSRTKRDGTKHRLNYACMDPSAKGQRTSPSAGATDNGYSILWRSLLRNCTRKSMSSPAPSSSISPALTWMSTRKLLGWARRKSPLRLRRLHRDGKRDLQEIRSSSGEVIHFTYDAQSRIIRAEDLRQHWSSYQYNNDGMLTDVQRSSGEGRHFSYDRTLMTSVADETGQVLVRNRYESGTLVGQEFANGAVYHYEYQNP